MESLGHGTQSRSNQTTETARWHRESITRRQPSASRAAQLTHPQRTKQGERSECDGGYQDHRRQRKLSGGRRSRRRHGWSSPGSSRRGPLRPRINLTGAPLPSISGPRRFKNPTFLSYAANGISSRLVLADRQQRNCRQMFLGSSFANRVWAYNINQAEPPFFVRQQPHPTL